MYAIILTKYGLKKYEENKLYAKLLFEFNELSFKSNTTWGKMITR